MARIRKQEDLKGIGTCPVCKANRVEIRVAGTRPQGRQGPLQEKTQLHCQACHFTEEAT